MTEDQHYLDTYLADILPKLGLDFDTYGVRSLFGLLVLIES